jgi:uncharacterized membrane protein
MQEAFPAVVTPYLPLIAIHIAGGVVAILTGYAAVLVRKGEKLHRAIGKVFIVAMLVMAGMATYLAITFLGVLPGQAPNIAAGALVPYLVGTAWVAARRKDATVGLFEKIAFVTIAGISAVFLLGGITAATSPTGKFDGYPSYFFFVFAGIAALMALLDLRVIRKGGLSGAPRIARHLWRMCFAFFFATGSFFLGQQKVMPEWMRGEWYLYALGLAPLAFLFFWLFRVRLTKWWNGGAAASPPAPAE